METQRNKASNSITNKPAMHNDRYSKTSNKAGKIKEDLIPAKDKSPDDLEIFD